MLNEVEKKNRIFYFTCSGFMILSLFFIMLTHGEAVTCYLHPDTLDSYMDLFNSIYAANRHTSLGIYPALASLPYIFLKHLVPSMWNLTLTARENAFILRSSLYGNTILLFHFLCFLIPMFIIISKKFENKKNELYLILFSIFLSGPFIFALERGNIIIYALLFTAIFFFWKDSDNKVKRELALLSLAIAANIKLYPAIFGLFLLDEKRWKEAGRCILYGLVLYFIPMLLFKGGISNFFGMGKNLSEFSSSRTTQSNGSGLNFSITNICVLLPTLINKFIPSFHFGHAAIVGKVLTAGALLLGIAVFFFLPKKWQKELDLALLCIFIPGVSFVYALIFLCIPVVDFILEDNFSKVSKENILVSVLFAITFSFITIPVRCTIVWYPVTASFVLIEIALFTLFIYTLVIGIYYFILNFSNRKVLAK